MAALLQFYSVFLPNINSVKLRLCDAFVAKLTPRTLPERVVVRSGAGRDFHVEVSKENGRVYLDRGWAYFVEDNRLMPGDFLVFRYDGDLSAFDVTIFDHTACEKENEPDDTHEAYHDYEDDSNGSDDEEEEEDSDDEGDEEGIDHVIISGSEMIHKVEEDSDDKGDDDIDNDVVSIDESFDESYEADSNNSRHRARKRKHVSPRSAAGSSEGGGSPCKRAYNRYGWVDSDAELLVEPDNLYFIFTQRFGKRENQLAVPSVAVRDFNVELADKILYRDPAGREYVGRVSKWKTGQIWIGGWKSFCKKNRLTADDKCVCELVVSGGERKCRAMRVHIVRNAFKNV